jgi:hypothetical protein
MYDKQVLIKQLSNGNPENYKLELVTKFESQCITFGYGRGWEKCMCLIRTIKMKHKYILNQSRDKMIDELREEINRNNKSASGSQNNI